MMTIDSSLRDIGIVIKYSILEELATVVTLIAIEPIKAMMTMKLKSVAPTEMFARIPFSKKSQPKRFTMKRMTKKITTANIVPNI